MVDKIFALKAQYSAEIEKLKVKVEVLEDLSALFATDPIVEETETEEVVVDETEEVDELATL